MRLIALTPRPPRSRLTALRRPRNSTRRARDIDRLEHATERKRTTTPTAATT
jgi:hypothetical protein